MQISFADATFCSNTLFLRVKTLWLNPDFWIEKTDFPARLFSPKKEPDTMPGAFPLGIVTKLSLELDFKTRHIDSLNFHSEGGSVSTIKSDEGNIS